MKSSAPFAVIIPSKTSSNLIPCLTALYRCEPDARVVVVDDGLCRQGREQAEFMGAVCVEGGQPFIFARNCNIGVGWANRIWPNGVGFVLLNDDAELQSAGGLKLLAQTCAEHPEIGVISAVTNSVGNTNQMRGRIGLRWEPRMVCFIAVYLPQATIDAVGLLDEDFTGYSHQDDDYCVRVRKAGLKIAIHDSCFVDHSRLKSTFRSPGGPGGDLKAGSEIFRKKWGGDNRSV